MFKPDNDQSQLGGVFSPEQSGNPVYPFESGDILEVYIGGKWQPIAQVIDAETLTQHIESLRASGMLRMSQFMRNGKRVFDGRQLRS